MSNPNEVSEETLEIINRVVKKLARKFKFGFHEIEDLEQEGRIFALEALPRHDGKRPLENFLWSHVHNRMYNLKRNQYVRPGKPCDTCPLLQNGKCTGFTNMSECIPYSKWEAKTNKRKSLVEAAPPDAVIQTAFEETNPIELSESRMLYELVDNNIPVEYRQDWIKFCNNTKLKKSDREQLIEVIKTILIQNNIEVDNYV